jgi:uncharacterized protein with HEPN domain
LTLPDRDLGYLEDIRKYAIRALSHVEGVTFAEFTGNIGRTDAVIRCLTVIGEAAGRLSKVARAELPQFDWVAMNGMRNILVHNYGRIDDEKVWDVVQNELPRLRDALNAFLMQSE